MNFYTCTAKILEGPKLLRFNSSALSKITFVMPSNRKSKAYYTMRAIAKGKVAKIIFNNYKKNDIVIVEGYIYIKKNIVQQTDNIKKYRVKKYIAIKIQRIYSVPVGFQ